MFVRRQIAWLLVLVAVALTPAYAQRRWQRPGNGPQQGQPRDNDSFRRDNQNRPDRPSNAGAQSDARTGTRSGDWLRKHSDMPPQDQQRALENDPAFRSLPPQQQNRLRDRLQWFNNLPPDRRERIIHRKEAWDRMSPEQKDRARDLFQRFQGVPDDRRKAMGFALRNLHNMTPEQRQRVMDSPQFRSSFSDDERNILRGMTDLNIGPAHRNPDGSPDNGPQD